MGEQFEVVLDTTSSTAYHEEAGKCLADRVSYRCSRRAKVAEQFGNPLDSSKELEALHTHAIIEKVVIADLT